MEEDDLKGGKSFIGGTSWGVRYPCPGRVKSRLFDPRKMLRGVVHEGSAIFRSEGERNRELGMEEMNQESWLYHGGGSRGRAHLLTEEQDYVS